jgi:hypothetical protein
MLLMGYVGQQLDIADPGNAIAGIQSSVAEYVQVDREQGRRIKLLPRECQELK